LFSEIGLLRSQLAIFLHDTDYLGNVHVFEGILAHKFAFGAPIDIVPLESLEVHF
jgi:hypothetical protein